MSTITATFKELNTEIPSTGNTITHKLFSSNNDIWCNIVCTGSEGSFITMEITGYSEVFKYRLIPNQTASINLKGIISRMINYDLTRLSLTDLQERTDTIKQFEITFTYGTATDVKNLTVLKAAQQVQSTYGEFSSEYAILDVDATEEQYKMKFLSCFENPIMYDGYPFTLGFVHSETGLAYKNRVKKTHTININPANGSTIVQTQAQDEYIYPINDIAIIELELNSYREQTNQYNRDEFLEVWMEGLEPFFAHNRTAENLTVSFYLDTKDELGSDAAVIDWGDGTVENIIINTNNSGGTVFSHAYNSAGNYIVNIVHDKSKIYKIDCKSSGANRITYFYAKKEWVNLYILDLRQNLLKILMTYPEWVNIYNLFVYANQLTNIETHKEWVNLYYIYVSNNQLTTLIVHPEWVNLYNFYAENNKLNELSINNILIIENNKNITQPRQFNIRGGTNASPTGAGLTAKNALISRGYTVTTN